MKKFAFCRVSISPLRAESKDSSEMISQLLFGEPVEIMEMTGKWTRINTLFDHYEGWLDSKHLLLLSEKEVKRWLDGLGQQTETAIDLLCPWGKQAIFRGSFLPENEAEIFRIGNTNFKLPGRRKNVFGDWQNFALSYLNTPYLWGGKSPFGIDCSGFTQQVFRFRQINLPRDAYQQADQGIEINFPEQQSGDLAFFSNDSGKITHVGIVLDEQKIIHSSSWVKIDQFKADGIYAAETLEKTHQLAFIKRF